MMNQKNKPISDWLVTESGVYLLFGEGYNISYNPSTIYTFNRRRMKDPLFQFEEDVDTEETALYLQSQDCYLILDGDFRKEYEACNSLRECLIVYKRHAPYHRSRHSMDMKAAL